MVTAGHGAGEQFTTQFVWELPDGDYVRAVFAARVLALDPTLDRYLLRLERLVAGRQETATGELRPMTDLTGATWELVHRLVGKRVYLAYEVEDGRPIKMRVATLTGEHTFFSRLDDLDV